MIKSSNEQSAEAAIFDRNRGLVHQLSRDCASFDKQLEQRLHRFRSTKADTFNFIEDLRRSTGYFLPAWWQEERSCGLDELEAKRRAALKTHNIENNNNKTRSSVKPPTTLPPLATPKIDSTPQHAVAKKAPLKSKLKATSTRNLDAIEELPPPASLTEKKAVQFDERQQEESITSTTLEPAYPPGTISDNKISEDAEFTIRSHEQKSEDVLPPASKNSNKSGKKKKKADDDADEAEAGDEVEEAVKPSNRLFERLRTMSLAQFHRLLDEVDAVDIIKWLPDYDDAYPMATRVGPSLKHISEETAESPPAGALDPEELADIRELKVIVGRHGLTGSKARCYLTRMFGRRHLKALQRPNYGLRNDTDGTALLERELGDRMGVFRQHYPTLPEMLMTVVEEGAQAIEDYQQQTLTKKRINEADLRTLSYSLRNWREGSKLPFLPNDSTSTSLLIPVKHRKQLKELQNYRYNQNITVSNEKKK